MTKKTETITDYSDLVESKLSRSEVIDILLQDMESDAKKRLAEVQAEKERLFKEISKDILASLVSNSCFIARLSYGMSEQLEKRKFEINASVHLDFTKAPKALQDAARRQVQLEAEERELGQVITSFGSKAARNTLLKKFLEGSDEGRLLLEKLDLFRNEVGGRLLAQAKASAQKQLAGKK